MQKYALLVYTPNISNYFFLLFLNTFAKVLMHNDVVEHIFMYGEIVCGNDERDTHYYITRGRVKA